MPNMTINTLKVIGAQESIDVIRRYFAETKPFQSIRPCPQVLRDTRYEGPKTQAMIANEAEYGYGSWYDWCFENWGTKWDIDPSEITITSENSLHVALRFETAWAPPRPLVLFLSTMFPECEFTLSNANEDDMYETTYIQTIQAGKVVKEARKGPSIRQHLIDFIANAKHRVMYKTRKLRKLRRNHISDIHSINSDDIPF